MSMTHDEMIAVLRAHKEGRAIQFRDAKDAGRWFDAGNYRWDFHHFEYRIKPEPRTIWVNEYVNDQTGVSFFNKDSAETCAESTQRAFSRIAVKYQEVIE